MNAAREATLGGELVVSPGNRDSHALFIGVDPGRLLGWCALLVPVGHDDPLGTPGASRWLDSGTITGKVPRKGETGGDSRARHYEEMRERWHRLIVTVGDYRAPIFVVENPGDATGKWARGRGVGTVTKFQLGMRFGFVLAAARQLGATAIHTYTVTRTGKTPGWYPTARTGNLVHPMARERVEWIQSRRIAAIMGTPDAILKLTSDELMSFGVLAYHLETGRRL